MARGDARSLLARLVRELEGRRIPRPKSLAELQLADVDLFEEDAYLAGLAHRFLLEGAIDVDEIAIDHTIDQRLHAALDSSSDRSLRDLLDYRERLNLLARALSQASGKPLAQRA